MSAMTVRFSPAIELITAAAACSRLWIEDTSSHAPRGQNDDPGLSWREAARAAMGPFAQADLDLVFGTVSTFAYLVHTVLDSGVHEPEAFLDHLRTRTADQLREDFRNLLRLDDVSELDDPERVRQALEDDRAREPVPFTEEARLVSAALATPDEFRGRILGVLEGFWSTQLSSRIGGIADLMQATVDGVRGALTRAPAPVLDHMSGGNYETLLASVDEVTVIPVWTASTLRVMLVPENAFILAGVTTIRDSIEPTDDPAAIAARTEELLKAIDDPTRLAMLRLLRARHRYGKELADELQISAGTASYHIDKLISARLLRVEHAQGRRFYYSINPGAVRELQHCLELEFLSGPDTDPAVSTV